MPVHRRTTPQPHTTAHAEGEVGVGGYYPLRAPNHHTSAEVLSRDVVRHCHAVSIAVSMGGVNGGRFTSPV